MARYVVAIKRSQRDHAPENWLELVRQIPGVKLEGHSAPNRAQITADPESISLVEDAVGDFCHIEPVILHYPSDSD